jgi:ketosteroid isomerase-like protein
MACCAQDKDADIIKQLNQQFLNALVQRDSVTLANILADDFILINPAGKRRTKADNLSTLRASDQSVTDINIDSEDLRMLLYILVSLRSGQQTTSTREINE